MELPWWAFSPSPFTLAFYILCSLYGGWKLYRIYGHNYKHIKQLAALTDAIFMLGFIVVSLDSIWVIACGLRFGLAYLDSIPQLLACLFRNTTIAALCYVFVKNYLQERANEVTFTFYLANIIFIAVWFALAPSPAWTDWTFAIRNNYPLATIISSFFISHIIGKTLTGLLYLTYF